MTNNEQAWRGAFIRTRSEGYKPNACQQFKKMMSFEVHLTCFFRKNFFSSNFLRNEKLDRIEFFSQVKSIKIEDLEAGICSVDNRWKQDPYYIRLNPALIADYLGDGDQAIQLKILNTLSKEIFDCPIRSQTVFQWGNRQEIALNHFKNPSRRIRSLIKACGIIDMFKLNNGMTVIHTTKDLNEEKLQGMALTDKDIRKEKIRKEKEQNYKFNEELIQKFVILSQDSNTKKLKCTFNDRVKVDHQSILTVIRQRIASPQTGMKKFLICHFEGKYSVILDKMIEKYFLDVWNNN